MSIRMWGGLLGLTAAVLAANLGGCPVTITASGSLQSAETQIVDTVGPIQPQDPRNITPPEPAVTRGDLVVLDPSVVVITDVATQIVVQEVPDITLIGLDNATGLDLYLRYYADGELQAVFVNADDALLLQYSCLTTIELVSEDHFDPVTGDFVEGFDLGGEQFTRPADFDCGEAFILTFDPQAITASTETIPL